MTKNTGKASSPGYRKVATIYHPSYGYEIERTICEYDGEYIIDVWGLVYRWDWIRSISVYWR